MDKVERDGSVERVQAHARKARDFPRDDYEILEMHLRRHFLKALPSSVVIERIVRCSPLTKKRHERNYRFRLQQKTHEELVAIASYSRRQVAWWSMKIYQDELWKRIIRRTSLAIGAGLVGYLVVRVFL